jgi:hypothetical protein
MDFFGEGELADLETNLGQVWGPEGGAETRAPVAASGGLRASAAPGQTTHVGEGVKPPADGSLLGRKKLCLLE